MQNQLCESIFHFGCKKVTYATSWDAFPLPARHTLAVVLQLLPRKLIKFPIEDLNFNPYVHQKYIHYNKL
jgi:hypothetical protein